MGPVYFKQLYPVKRVTRYLPGSVEAECAPRIAAGAEALDATFGLGAFESPPSDP